MPHFYKTQAQHPGLSGVVAPINIQPKNGVGHMFNIQRHQRSNDIIEKYTLFSIRNQFIKKQYSHFFKVKKLSIRVLNA